MKKILALAIIALAAAFMGCSDVKGSVMPHYENEESAAYSNSETHLFMSCKAAGDANATIHYDYIAVNDESKLTRTYHHDFAEGAADACDIVKKNAANNETVNCSETTVDVVTEYEGLTANDYMDMAKAECVADK